jgi:hypothetical protein
VCASNPLASNIKPVITCQDCREYATKKKLKKQNERKYKKIPIIVEWVRPPTRCNNVRSRRGREVEQAYVAGFEDKNRIALFFQQVGSIEA